MLIGADTRIRSSLVSPTGQLLTLATVMFSPEQARLVRAYERDIGRALKLAFARRCRRCGSNDPMEWEVNDQFIALACKCTMYAFSGPTPLPHNAIVRAQELPEGALVDAGGHLMPKQRQAFTLDQGRLMRAYGLKILLPYGIVETTHCQVCEDSATIANGAVKFWVRRTHAHLECRHAVYDYFGSIE